MANELSSSDTIVTKASLKDILPHSLLWVHYMSRDHALDATRTVAIWFMIVCHVARLIYKEGYQLNDSEGIFPRMRPPFKEADLDGTNSLSIEEFSTLFQNSSDGVISTTFKTFDNNQDLLLSFKEITSGTTRVPLRPFYMDFSLDIEPLCQALFMTMVGVSMLYSLKLTRKPDRWNRSQLRRAGELYAIGFVFFHRTVRDSITEFCRAWHPHFYFFCDCTVSSACSKRALRLSDFYWSVDDTANAQHLRHPNLVLSMRGNGPFMPHVILTVFGISGEYFTE